MEELHLAGVRKCFVEESRTMLTLVNLIVEPAQRGKGIGRAAVLHVKELARKRGKWNVVVTLDPKSERPADLLRFYQKLGFRCRAGGDNDVLVCSV